MEVFVDGGLFELIIAIVFGYAINYILLKKYLLILFSVISVVAPLALLFLNKGEWYQFVVILCIINSILLVILLWKQRDKFPDQPLFDLSSLKRKLKFKRGGHSSQLPRTTIKNKLFHH